MKKASTKRAEHSSADWIWYRWAPLLAGLAALLYINSLSGKFVFDDLTLIQDNQMIRSWRDLPSMFGRQGYRPVRTLSYALNYYFFGLDPFYYHVTNVLIHAVNGVLVFLLLRRIFGSDGKSFAGTLLFLCHPIQTAAVAYISGRKDLLATGFLLGGMLGFAHYRERKKISYFVFAMFLFTLALFSKEVAVIFPLLLLIWDFFREHPEPGSLRGRDLWARLRRTLAVHRWLFGSLLAMALGFLYYAQYVTHASRKPDFWGGSVLNNYLTALKLFSHYIQMALVPFPLVADYNGVFPIAKGLIDWTVWVAIIFTLAYFYWLYHLLLVRPRAGFGLLWFFITLLPVLQLLPFHEIAADHFLYLPLIGFVITIVEVADWKFSRLPLRVILAAVCVIFSALTIVRNRDWESQLSLWRATVRYASDSARAQTNFGTSLQASGDLEGALPHLVRATELDPYEATHWSNLGTLYLDRGDYEAAVDALAHASGIDPDNAYTHSVLGTAYKRLAQSRNLKDPNDPLWKNALWHSRRAVTLREADGMLHYNLGIAYKELGFRMEARNEFETSKKLAPDFANADFALGVLDSEEGDLSSAILHLQDSIFKNADNLGPYQVLADIHVKRNDYAAARMLLEFAVNRFPGVSDLRLRLGLVYLRLGKTADARDQLSRGLELDPTGSKANEIRQLLNSLN
ncbi:MAG TPA: tetratricopeptide repeat protein [Acidobacteriota bacterium]